MKNASYFFGLLIILSLLFSACKKDRKNKDEKADILTGFWVEIPYASYTSTIQFLAPNRFQRILKGTGDDQFTLNGTYSIEGNKLNLNVTETVEKKSGSVIKETVNYLLFEKATFTISNSSLLTISYTSYPADAPLVMEAKFNKVLPID